VTFRFPRRLPLRVAVVFAVFAALGMGAWNCARAGEKSHPKVLLIGVDAGEWSVLGPLLDQQKAPAFALLRAQGAAGKLRSLEPLTKSPIIWASIATGKVPEKHGISNFFARQAENDRAAAREAAKGAEGESPATSNLWRARPVWDILGSLGKKVGVVGWWTTWPAQPVNGFLISDYVQYDTGSWPAKDSRRTYPASLDSLVAAVRRTPQSVSWAELFQFVAPFDTTKATQRQLDLVQGVRWVYAADMTFYRVAMNLYKTQHPEFMTVYFRGVDEVSHQYWDIDLPGGFNPPLTDVEYQWMKRIIPNYYIFTDRLIGNLMKEADSQTNIIVCSDHGFGGGGKGVMAHKLDGILFMKGPNVKKEANITGATVLDVTPTILALYGLPTAQDMDGRPIEDALTPGTMKKVARETRLKTYETGKHPGGGGQPIASPVDEELRERLRSLGYIQ
jgi:predicted AlkP superfamily phosphohydrolase/phosphomutase